jgi:hypothetical protein
MRFKIKTSLTLADNPVRVIDVFIDDLAVNSDWG